MRDKSLICAYSLDGNGGGRALDWKEINAWSPSDGDLWVHLDYKSKKTKEWLKHEAKLDPIIVSAMTREETRPRCLTTRDGILLFLRGVNLNPGEEPEDMVSVRFWIDKNRVITTRRRLLLSIKDLREAIEQNLGPRSASKLVVALNDKLLNRMHGVIEGLKEKSDLCETDVLLHESRLLQPRISDIRRQAILIKRYLEPQKNALYQLHTEKNIFLPSEEQLNIREANDRLIRYVEDLDSVRERAVVTQEELSSRLSEKMERKMYLLSVVSLIFLPMTFVTGLLGINVAGIPGTNNPMAFGLVCLGLVVMTVITVVYLRFKKWM